MVTSIVLERSTNAILFDLVLTLYSLKIVSSAHRRMIAFFITVIVLAISDVRIDPMMSIGVLVKLQRRTLRVVRAISFVSTADVSREVDAVGAPNVSLLKMNTCAIIRVHSRERSFLGVKINDFYKTKKNQSFSYLHILPMPTSQRSIPSRSPHSHLREICPRILHHHDCRPIGVIVASVFCW